MLRAVIAMCMAAAAWCQSARPAPEDYYRRSMGDPGLSKKGFGEQFCWVARYYQPTFLRAYQSWKDPAWIEWAVRYGEFEVSKMQTGADGYRGWIGPYEYDNSVWCDVHVGDALLAGGLLELAEVILGDEALRKKYGETAQRWVELARRDVMEKWDKRGTWEEDGAVGAYRSWNRYCEPGDPQHSRVRDEIKESGLALPFNKQNDMGLVALRLYRITGEARYRARAEKIFAYEKSRFQYFDGHYLWNYWEPFSARDIDKAAGKTLHWVGVHPYRNYQEREVEQMVEAYQTGVVFTQEDMERVVNTNLKVMWNGSLEDAKFRNSNATLAQAPGAAPRKDTAGGLWPALVDFSQTVRDLERRRLDGGKGAMGEVARAYFENVTMAAPPGFVRRYASDKARPVEFPIHECAGINMAAALPAVLSVGDETLLVASLPAPGKLLVTVDGVPVYRTNRAGLVIAPWKPSAEDRGERRVRWSVEGGGYREFVVRVK